MTFYETVTEAIRDIEAHGYDSPQRLDDWTRRILEAAKREMRPEQEVEALLRDSLNGIYQRLVTKGGLLKQHQVSRFTLERVKPKLRAELDRRIMASANLIKLNREETISNTLRRFQGWATSIPAGGSDAIDKNGTKRELRKALAQLPFRERRVIIDQGHKFNAALNNIVAMDGGAIALIWKSHYLRAGYNYREDHKERDGRVYLIRGNWAQEKGLVKVGPDGYYDDITAVGEEVFCSCYAVYIYSLRKLPDNMITEKGRQYGVQGVKG